MQRNSQNATHQASNHIKYFAPNRTPYFVPGLYSGFTNQRNSFYGSAILSMLKNWTLVLPHWVFEYNNAEGAQTRPFNYFYHINTTKLSNTPELINFRYAHHIPDSHLPSCLRQLQCKFATCTNPTIEVIDKWMHKNEIACVNADTSYYKTLQTVAQFYGKSEDVPSLPIMHLFRSILVPSQLYQGISEVILGRLYDKYHTRVFVSVHARIEADFVHACSVWPKKSWEPADQKTNKPRLRECMVTDEGILRALVDERVPLQTVLLIMNGHDSDFAFPALSALCKAYQCVRKEMLWSLSGEAPVELVRTPTSVAMIDALLASHAIHFFGNMYSTMSLDIYYSRVAEGKKASMYNYINNTTV